MTTHDRVLELAAGAIDFELTAPERRTLDDHLFGCNSCRRHVDALGADARAIADHRAVTLSPATSSAILARVIITRRTASLVRLVAIAALLVLLTLAAAAVVGAVLQRLQEDRLTVVMPSPPVLVSPTPSPAAATGQILFEDGGAIFAIDLPSGVVTRLADGETSSWSPDGLQIAFTRNAPDPQTFDPKLWVMDANGGNQTQLGDGRNPVWSPDGRRIAFSRSPIDLGDLFVMNADASGILALEGGSDFDWSPDGARIATVTGNATAELGMVEADGTGRTRLAAGRYPDWSPDGTRIAFVGGPNGSIDLVDPSTGDVSTIAADVGAAMGVAWSPDGSRIAFSSLDSGDLLVVPMTGSDPVRVVDGLDTANAPAWSEDGTWIVFTMEATGAEAPRSDLWLVRSDGSGAHPLTASGSARGPAWRP